MVKRTIIWSSVMSAALVLTYRAAASGTGIAQPSKNPPSIREGSVTGQNGLRKTRYFVGGGLRGGK